MTTEGKSMGEIAIEFMEACMENGVDKQTSKIVWMELMTNSDRYVDNDDNFKELVSDNFTIDEYISIINFNKNLLI